MNTLVIIPALNAESTLPALLDSLCAQKGCDYDIQVIDSSSGDSTVALAREAGCHVYSISQKDFNHGATRWQATLLHPEATFVVYLTQDVVLENEYALARLLHALEAEDVGCAYGRQLPCRDANIFAAHARNFNYPPVSRLKSKNDADSLGLATAFLSNSFAAYRMDALRAVGGFPPIDYGEDMCAAAKMLMIGWKVAYVAEARAYHSHNLTLWQEFCRCRSMGKLHQEQPWILDAFGHAEHEALSFVLSETKTILRCTPWLLPKAMLRNAVKYLGYLAGKI